MAVLINSVTPTTPSQRAPWRRQHLSDEDRVGNRIQRAGVLNGPSASQSAPSSLLPLQSPHLLRGRQERSRFNLCPGNDDKQCSNCRTRIASVSASKRYRCTQSPSPWHGWHPPRRLRRQSQSPKHSEYHTQQRSVVDSGQLRPSVLPSHAAPFWPILIHTRGYACERRQRAISAHESMTLLLQPERTVAPWRCEALGVAERAVGTIWRRRFIGEDKDEGKGRTRFDL